MSVAPIGPVGPVGPVTPASGVHAPAKTSFAEAIGNALEGVSAAEGKADMLAKDIASGGDTPVHELMVAMSEASLSLEMLVQVRNRALEAYQEIMRMQV